MKRLTKTRSNVELDKLLDYREADVERCIAIGEMALKTFETYQALAYKASIHNPLAQYITMFTFSLIDKPGSFGSIEFAVRSELENKSQQ